MESLQLLFTGVLLIALAIQSVVAPPSCPSSNPCRDPVSNNCVECCEDGHCSGSTPFCETISHNCVECLNDEHCSDMYGTPVCNTGINQCEAECNSTGECAANEVCSASTGYCVCSTDMDPCNGPQEHCDGSGNCGCDSGYYRNEDGDCVQDCTLTADCESNEICNNGQCVCNGTLIVCDDPGRVCNSEGQCVCDTGYLLDGDGNCVLDCHPECGENELCTRALTCVCAPGYVRVSGNCVQVLPDCIVNADCGSNEICNDGQCVCNVTLFVCDDPGRACNSEGQCVCDTGYLLDGDGNCVLDCHPECGENELCTRALTCVCAPGYVSVSGNCVQVLPECVNDFDCRNEGEVCGENNRCRCSEDTRLFRGRCVLSGYLGGLCLPNGKCYGGKLTCDAATNTCVCPGDCNAVTVCVNAKKLTPWR